jgi:hypothetical protein
MVGYLWVKFALKLPCSRQVQRNKPLPATAQSAAPLPRKGTGSSRSAPAE